MKKFLAVLFLLIVSTVGIGVGMNAGAWLKDNPEKNVLPAATKNVQSIQEVEPGIPQTVRIPKINVDAAIESVGTVDNNPQNSMDVPKDSDNTAWYNLGYKPGQKGNAVIAGHFDKKDGSPAVFWDIAKLEKGDKIIVVDDAGKELTFAVVRIEKHPHDNFPLQEVFGESSQEMLNLITCEGTFDPGSNLYSHRTVVYTELIK